LSFRRTASVISPVTTCIFEFSLAYNEVMNGEEMIHEPEDQ
jgi:hypothetical protein